jgi:sRNA-binding protein
MNERELRAARAFVVIELLARRWPAAFSIYEQRRKPLKLGIHLDIMAALDGAITKPELMLGLGYYTNNVGYLRASRKSTPRIDLDGNAVGAVSIDEAQWAIDRLDALGSFASSGEPRCCIEQEPTSLNDRRSSARTL